MRTRVKICGVTTIEALEACINAGVDAVGFVFAESPRRIDPGMAGSLITQLPAVMSSVGVFKGHSSDQMSAVARRAGVAVIQADASELTGLSSSVEFRLLPVYRTGGSLERAEATTAPLILIEGPTSGSGRVPDWTTIAEVARRRRVVLAGGLTAGNVAEAIRTVRPFAVDVSSGVESSPGVKDPRLIREFVTAVRRADLAMEGS